MRFKPGRPADERIVIISETEEDLHRFGHPLSDDVLAQLLEKLTAGGAWSIGMDKYRDIPVPPGSERLHKILQSNRNIIWVFNTDIPPPKILADTDQVGANAVPLDQDGIVRRGLLFMDYADSVAFTFPLMLTLRYLERQEIFPTADEKIPEHIRLGQTTIPPLEANDGSYINTDAGGYQFMLDYPGAPNRFTTYTLSEVLDGKDIPENTFKAKIVIFGARAESLNDYFFTPFVHDRYADEELLYGVELHGYVVSQLLNIATNGAPVLRTISNHQEIGWLWLWCMIGTAVGIWLHALWRFTVAMIVGCLLLASIYYLAFVNYLWIPLVPQVLGFFLSATLVTSYMRSQQKAERQMVMQLFAQHVSSAVAETIWQERDRFMESGRLASHRVTATVLFTDIKGFTTISESMDPQSLMEWLNIYMDHMAEVIIRHNGTINKYIGDAIMALFGVPLYRTHEKDIARDAQNAVECALDMGAELERLNANWTAQNLPSIGMRVGIFTGPLVAGSLGSSQRLEYTVIGDTVNTASRLESYKRVQNPDDTTHDAAADAVCRILVGENTMNYLDQDLFKISHYGKVKLKGKAEEIDIYWVQGRR
jgi:adenylate cyclase